MTLHFIAPAAGATADLEPVWEAITAADDKATNARQMVLNRDPRLEAVEFTAAQAEAAHAELLALINAVQLTPGPQGERGPAGADGAPGLPGTPGAKGDTGDAGAAGTPGAPGQTGSQGAKGDKGDTGNTGLTGNTGPANLAIGARPIASLANNATTNVVFRLSRTMPDTNYSAEFAHTIATTTTPTAVYTNIVKTTTSVTVTVRASGALAAGTMLCIAW